VANMILGSGICPVPALRRAGIPVGLGTDGAASNDSQNMLEAVKAAALLQKVARLDPRALTAGDVLAMATREGARALGLDGLVGSLEPGKRADVIRLRATGPAWPTFTTPASRSSTAAPPPMWPTSGWTAAVGDPADAWSTTTWPP
jgi:cytosine/adenosine deaminase-related metal-dependent hydrolase